LAAQKDGQLRHLIKRKNSDFSFGEWTAQQTLVLCTRRQRTHAKEFWKGTKIYWEIKPNHVEINQELPSSQSI
jgi:hypothetical protein